MHPITTCTGYTYARLSFMLVRNHFNREDYKGYGMAFMPPRSKSTCIQLRPAVVTHMQGCHLCLYVCSETLACNEEYHVKMVLIPFSVLYYGPTDRCAVMHKGAAGIVHAQQTYRAALCSCAVGL